MAAAQSTIDRPAYEALKARNAAALDKALSKKINGNGVNSAGFTLLFFAVGIKDPKLLKMLLSKGKCDPNFQTQDPTRQYPLTLAAAEGQDEMVKALLQHGANPTLTDAKKVRRPLLQSCCVAPRLTKAVVAR